MARHDLEQLYEELCRTRFRFVGRGEFRLQDIYTAVKSAFRSLCDDGFLCSENCSRGGGTPEWQHVVRKALDRLRVTSDSVAHGSKRGRWRLQHAK